MKCPHCHTSIHGGWSSVNLAGNGYSVTWQIEKMDCPECDKIILILQDNDSDEAYYVYPRFPTRSPVPADVPITISKDYTEACAVLEISPKASAALSRRCLQNILNSNGYKSKNLAQQVDAALNESNASKALSPALATTIDAIRNFGNFSAHPITDITTNQIIPVEPHEAEFCLEVIEEMFDHFYVRPALASKRKAALDAKLATAGKPASK